VRQSLYEEHILVCPKGYRTRHLGKQVILMYMFSER